MNDYEGTNFKELTTGAQTKSAAPPRFFKLVAIPVELTAILIQIAIFASDFPALVASGSVVAISEVAAQFVAVASNLALVVTDVAVQAAVIGKRRHNTHSY